jgi:cytidylate kinase
MAASTISSVPSVRRVLVSLQQELGRREGGVLEGRDIGTKVFPETPHKFFLSARPDVRAQRRHRELRARGGDTTTLEQLAREMKERDQQDSTREDSPLTCNETYTQIDTSDLSIEQVVDRIVGSVRERQPSSP